VAANEGVKAPDRESKGPSAVAVVANAPARRRQLARLLAAGGLEVVAEAATPQRSAVERVANDRSLVVVLSCSAAEAASSIRALKQVAPEARVVLVADEPGPARAFRAAVRAEVEAVVYGDDVDEALVPSVRAVFAEQVVFPRRERRNVAAPVLSHRERQVLRLAVQGRTNDEIASRLYIATSTVKGHLTSAFAKLAVGSRSEAAALVLDPDEPLGRALLATPVNDGESTWR
jgi:DNA-binding NarL/FixJ family response regulator